jgi:hypothetical protein
LGPDMHQKLQSLPADLGVHTRDGLFS